MPPVAYVNGRFMPLGRAGVGVEDRGNQFADGVYEVVKVLDRQPRDLDRHLARLGRSLGALDIDMPMREAALRAVIAEAIRRSRLRDALLYLQVSRGASPRNHLFPPQAKPTLILTVRRPRWPSAKARTEGVGVITRPDNRWGRCDIKSIALLANVLVRQEAHEQGCYEAWLVDDAGRVTEGSASNAYIVDPDGRLVTHPTGPAILAGVTRSVVLELARDDGIEVVERPFEVDEARRAREAFLTSTSSWVLPVTTIDGRPVANGAPGSVTTRLMERYAQRLGRT